MPERTTALVLGAGGVVGAAWLVGALRAIQEETGFDPRNADCILGTSAGAAIGALLAAGLSPEQIEDFARRPEAEDGLRRGLKLHWTFPRPVLGSPELALRSLLQPWRYGPAGIIGWLPQGVISTKPLEGLIASAAATWPKNKCLWIVAVDYATGGRVVFGREGSGPAASLPSAVAASCAVPGFFFPVSIDGHRYIDGGMYSTANLDLAGEMERDVVICLHPMSSRFRGGFFEPTGPVATLVRGDPARRLDREVRRLNGRRTQVLVLEPRAADIRAMGYNYMSGRRAAHVAQTALSTTAASLRRSRAGRILSSLAAKSAASSVPAG